MIYITSDSCLDLTKNQIKENDIKILPLSVNLGDEEYFDGENIKAEDIFDYVKKTGVLPKTAARSVEDFKDFFKPFLEDGNQVIHISISDALSSCYQNAVEAKKQLKDDNLYIVDSKSLSTGIGLLVLYAASLVKEGCKAGLIYNLLLKQSNFIQASFVVDKLDYLYKGGRCSALARMGANLLKLKPRLELKDGKIENTGKYRGTFESILFKYIDDMMEIHNDYINDICFITHTRMEESLVQKIVNYVKDKKIFKQVCVSEAGSTISCHCGENTLGILYKTKMK